MSGVMSSYVSHQELTAFFGAILEVEQSEAFTRYSPKYLFSTKVSLPMSMNGQGNIVLTTTTH